MNSTQELLDALAERFPDDEDELREACTELLRHKLGTIQRLAKLSDSQWQRLNLPMGIETIIREEVEKVTMPDVTAVPSTQSLPSGSLSAPCASSASDMRTASQAASQNNPVYIATNPSGAHLVSNTDAVTRTPSDFSRARTGEGDREPDMDPADDVGTLSTGLTEFRMAHTASMRRWGTGPLETQSPRGNNSGIASDAFAAAAAGPPPTPPPPPPGVAPDGSVTTGTATPEGSEAARLLSPPGKRPVGNNDLLSRIEENYGEAEALSDATPFGNSGVTVKNTFLEVTEPISPKLAGAQSFPVTSMRRRAAAAATDGTESAEVDPPSRRMRAGRGGSGGSPGQSAVDSSLASSNQTRPSYAATVADSNGWVDSTLMSAPPPHLDPRMAPSPWGPWPPHLGPSFPQMMAYPNMIPLPHLAAMAPPPSGKIQPRHLRKPQHSQGSALHASGQCKPCAWFWKPQGCENAEQCLHCHLCPEGELKARKKEKIIAMRQGHVDPGNRW